MKQKQAEIRGAAPGSGRSALRGDAEERLAAAESGPEAGRAAAGEGAVPAGRTGGDGLRAEAAAGNGGGFAARIEEPYGGPLVGARSEDGSGRAERNEVRRAGGDSPNAPGGRRRNAGGGGPRLMKGAAVMGIAMLASKTLGTLQKIPLQNIAGDRVFGIYNAVYPLYQLLLVMVTAGFPVAVSLLVAEREAAGDREGSSRVLTASVWLLSAGGAAGFLLLWTGSRNVAAWLGDDAAASAVRASALAFWVAPAMAAFRGYYQGRGQMLPSAVSQLSEQTVRVAGMLLLLMLGWHLGWPDDRLAAGATAGSAIGGLAGLIVIAAYWLRERRADKLADRDSRPDGRVGDRADPNETDVQASGMQAEHKHVALGQLEQEGTSGRQQARRTEMQQARAEQDGSGPAAARGPMAERAANERGAGLLGLMRRLAWLAVPVTLGALAVPVLNVVDAFTVPRLLRGTGLAQDEAMALFGLYSRGQPLVQLVVMVAGAMGGALVPALAGARASGDGAAVRQQAALILRAAWGIGAAAALGLALLAEPINVMLYADAAGTRTFALVGCTALAGTVSALAAAVLQGLGAVRTPALLMLAAAAMKAAFNAALVPALGTVGAACAGIAALTAAALLGSAAVSRAAGAAMPARRAAGMGLALACMAAVLVLAERGGAPLLGLALPPRAAAAALALGGTALGGAAFAAAVLRFGGVTARELRALPGGDALAARLSRWRLLPRGA
ncbi:polysaccharide biosynthesis protein [Paenibacillus lycopersici]|uniref:Polysaccharide biosynthesis protein n=1 Tax=Paenibacillus lycopersici TaxID=2704462 RepID=A0A6C0FUT9_9BACL|nr:polysaccharide biosynthesis protein [Paenibacillus lycopersici]QHT58699.1 polysaccharide biosynthesis protein [Paenibacillus lycopersici]